MEISNQVHAIYAPSIKTAAKSATSWLNKFLKQQISKKEYLVILEQIKALATAPPSELVLTALHILDDEIMRKDELISVLKYTKRDILFNRQLRAIRRNQGFNNACRLCILAKDAIKANLISFEDYYYIWNNMGEGKAGLNSSLIDSLNARYLSKLLDYHPLYSSIKKAENRIRRMLVNLEFNKPLIP